MFTGALPGGFHCGGVQGMVIVRRDVFFAGCAVLTAECFTEFRIGGDFNYN